MADILPGFAPPPTYSKPLQAEPKEPAYGFLDLTRVFSDSLASSENRINQILLQAVEVKAALYFDNPDPGQKRISLKGDAIEDLLEKGPLRDAFLQQAQDPKSKIVVDFEGQAGAEKKFSDFNNFVSKHEPGKATLVVYGGRGFDMQKLNELAQTGADIEIQPQKSRAMQAIGEKETFPTFIRIIEKENVVAKTYRPIGGGIRVTEYKGLEHDSLAEELNGIFKQAADGKSVVPVSISGTPEQIANIQKKLKDFALDGKPAVLIGYGKDPVQLAEHKLEARVGVAWVPPASGMG